MTDTRFIVLDDTQRHPGLAKQISRMLRQVAPAVNEITDSAPWIHRIERGLPRV
ncbi:hypothetical protein ACIQPR_48400 [Streptomyces sp. NPDC091280]|uniref:hypothetical protein n=1 Tax=Streptomyces sp. NPDC091280 TaxID=3365984 RepID=UPI003810FE33